MGGLRKRSVSESEAIDLTTKPLDGTNFGNDLNHPLFLNTRGVSNPDLSSSNSGYITTPLGAGVSTRLISGGRDEKLYNRVVQEYHTLKNQIFTYQELISDAKPTTKEDVESVFKTFYKRINELAQGCLIRKMDFKLHSDIVQLLPIVKRARQVHLRRCGLEDEVEYEETYDEDDDDAFLSPTQNSARNTSTPNPESNDEDECRGQSSKVENTILDNTDNLVDNIRVLKSHHGEYVPVNAKSSVEMSGDGFHGFSTVLGEIEALKLLIDQNKKAAECNDWKLEKKIVSVSTNLKKTERSLDVVSQNVVDLSAGLESNSVRISRLEEKTFNLSVSVKGVENRIMKRIVNLELWMESTQFEDHVSDKNNSQISTFPRECKNEVSKMKLDLKALQKSISTEKETMNEMKSSVKMLQEKVNSSLADITASTCRIEEKNLDIQKPVNPKSLGIIKLGIERYIQQINQLTRTRVTQNVPDLKLIEKCNNVDVPKVSKAITSCGDALEKYVRIPGMDEEYVDEISAILVSATEWCLQVEGMYSKMEIHSITNTKGDTSEVGIFTDNATRTVYEFLQDVELAIMGWGSQAQRANRLITKHLSPTIRDRIIDKAHNFQEIKSWLIEHYGDASRIVNDTINALAKKKKPTSGSTKDRYKFYSEIVVSILRLERLTKEKLIDTKQLNDCLHSRSTLHLLISLLPVSDFTELKREMSRRDIDHSNPVGPLMFSCFKEFCVIERNAMEGGVADDPEPVKPKLKTAHGARVTSDEGSEDDSFTATYATSSPAPVFKRWYPAGLRFPCPLDNHKHETMACGQFFGLCPKERWNRIEKRKVCMTCMKPKDVCSGIKCSHYKKVPEILLCSGCGEYAEKKGWAPLNILYCKRSEHKELRASLDEIKKAWEKYLGKFECKTDDASIRVTVNFMYQAYNVSCDSQISSSVLAPSINSSSGAKVAPAKDKIIPEKKEDSFYMMQTLKIGSSTVLAFLDSGSNAHLIDEHIATSEGLLKTSEKPTAISVVGGGNIKSSKSTYQFNLGPGGNGEYFEMNCIGMEAVTTKFREYNLAAIGKEYKLAYGPGADDVPLPKKIGGTKVHLLIGIKNALLTPVLERVLDSGVAVYVSPFTDIYGSNRIFAGPHPSFTKSNRGVRTHAVYAFRKELESIYDDVETEDEEDRRSYSMYTDRKHGLTCHPHPLNEDDVRDIGVAIPPELEDLVDHVNDSKHERSGFQAHYCGIFKATVPIARMREILDLDDCDEVSTYRCPECSKCIKCKNSVRRNAISLQEAAEQEIIENSVILDKENKRVVVTLPFTQDPVKALTKRHGGPNNYNQAIKVYKTQCRKPDQMKEQMIKSHAELVEQGFMSRLHDMPEKIKELINNAPFLHYHPWRIVSKEDSISTPIRLVVDPTMTGLNLILPKGENRLGSINQILIGNRADPYAWASDISKLYNQLHLAESALPYSLFLYSPELNPEKDPEVWVMNVAWYGVTPTGAQAGCAIERVVMEGGTEYPLAVQCLVHRRYVDDLAPGAQTKVIRTGQEVMCTQILESIGLKLKYIVRSGEEPCERASSDGVSVKLLGYKWCPKEDTISPGFAELNMNKRVRGAKKPNEFPVITREDATKLLASIKITKRIVVSKVSELYDPIGLFEPIKLQLKLEMTKLSGLLWDDVVPDQDQDKWKGLLSSFVDLSKISVNRCTVPTDEESNSGIRLICLADAAEHAGGTAVYAGRRLKDGSWSCTLMSAKSKLMKGTIPRNELSAIMLMTEVAFIVKKALGDRVEDVIYITDSTIALCWVHNIHKRLRIFVLNRVETIRRMIEWTTEDQDIPLFHIDGTQNLADLLTKEHLLGVADVSTNSEWQEGKSWMRLATENMPIKRYSDLTVTPDIEELVKSECFDQLLLDSPISTHTLFRLHADTVVISAAAAGRGCRSLLIDPVYFGWFRTLRILKTVLKFIKAIRHKSHKSFKLNSCHLCCEEQIADWEAEQILVRYESDVIKGSLKLEQRKMYTEVDGILYYQGRITAENPFKTMDLDEVPFLDTNEFSGKVPVVLVDSPVLYSYLMAVHTRINPHAGVEISVKTVSNKFKVHGNLRALIRRVKSDCTKCALILKKTVELEMSPHPEPRTILAPPFYSVMMDIAYGFPGVAFKNARKSIKVYALVFVCLMSGATNIIALEGIETQDVAQALEKHACRYGVPADVYVDQGTQLKALEHAELSIRDLTMQVVDSLGIRVHVSNAKSHEERGRVERKIRAVRETLEKTGVKTTSPMTVTQWDCVFAKVANTIDDLPLARGDSSNVSNIGYEIITANRLKLGRNNNRSMEGPGVRFDKSQQFSRILERNREIYQCWYQLFIDNIHNLAVKPPKWSTNSRKPVYNDIVLFTFNDSGYSKSNITWKLGRISEASERKVQITFLGNSSLKGPSKMHTVERNPRDVSILFSVGDFNINTQDHLNNLINGGL